MAGQSIPAKTIQHSMISDFWQLYQLRHPHGYRQILLLDADYHVRSDISYHSPTWSRRRKCTSETSCSASCIGVPSDTWLRRAATLGLTSDHFFIPWSFIYALLWIEVSLSTSWFPEAFGTQQVTLSHLARPVFNQECISRNW